ncbi:MAG: beta-eliminating lyase-related protein [Fimbriimonas sp.]|nr:beta-eliminating lyase-related protein [Fimbriimonas sp.]
MTQEELAEAAKACTHFLRDHYPRTPRQRMQDIADSPFIEARPDHYGNGGFVVEFEKELSDLLGKEAAVFMPSGTMAQQIALRIWADQARNRHVAFHPTCHLELHEHAAYRELHHLQAHLLGEPSRLFTLADLESVGDPISSLLIEFPQREIGGQLPSWDDFQAIVEIAKRKGIRLHLDGARLWECGPFFGRSYREIVADFDSVYVSFYKILFGLPGAVLAGPADFIAEARVWQRRHGGNLVHMFPNAISAKLGIDKRLALIPSYVAKAAEVAEIMRTLDGVQVVPEFPPTNMMHVFFDYPKERIMDAVGEIALRERCLLFGGVGATEQGCKLELWIGDAALDLPRERLELLLKELVRLAGS